MRPRTLRNAPDGSQSRAEDGTDVGSGTGRMFGPLEWLFDGLSNDTEQRHGQFSV